MVLKRPLPFLPTGGKFEIQNKLQEGYIYDVTIDAIRSPPPRWKRAMWPVF